MRHVLTRQLTVCALIVAVLLAPSATRSAHAASEKDAGRGAAPEANRIGAKDLLQMSVIGEVAKPGRSELKSWTMVLDVLAMAGGFTQFASRSKVVILQQDGATMKRIPFNYNRIASDQENFYLRGGDIVLVP